MSNVRSNRHKGDFPVKLTDILEQNAERRMEIESVRGESVTADSWTIGDELLRANIGQEGKGGYSVYISLKYITKVTVI